MKRTIKRFTSLLLVLVMCMGMVCTSVYADDAAHSKNHLLDGFCNQVVNKEPTEGYEYVLAGLGEMSEFWESFLYTSPSEEYPGETPIVVGGKKFYTRSEQALAQNRDIDGIYYGGKFYPAEEIKPGNPKALRAHYNGMQQICLKNDVTGEYLVVYCADKVTSTTEGSSYNVVNIEDALYYNDDQAGKIRAIALNGYWENNAEIHEIVEEGKEPSISNIGVVGSDVNSVGSLEYVKAQLRKSGQFSEKEIALLTPGIAVTATQEAIWKFSNAMDEREFINIRYIVEKNVTPNNGLTYNTLVDTPSSEQDCVKLLFKYYEYLINLAPVSVEKMTTANTVLTNNNILKDIDIVVVEKAKGHENNADANWDNDAYVTDVTFDMAVTPQEANGDDLVAKVVDENGTVYATGRIAGQLQDGEIQLVDNGNGTYTFNNITLLENEELTYSVTIEGVQHLWMNAYLYTTGSREASQTLVGFNASEHEVDITSSVKASFNVDDPRVKFPAGGASNISFMLIDRATGEVEFLKKIDIGGETSFEIPAEEGKISAVFVKQSTSGMFWIAEMVDAEVLESVIECLKDNNPSYKGHNAVAYGAGDHELEFKKGKFVTYTFAGCDSVEIAPEEEVKEEVEEEVEEKVEEETSTKKNNGNNKNKNKNK